MKKSASDTRQHILDVAKSIIAHKGYTAVGLAELVTAAGVPKGSFYYYFKSKEEFGQILLKEYFNEYLSRAKTILSSPEGTAHDRLLNYFRVSSEIQTTGKPEDKCLTVKLGAEVCDLSEGMRSILCQGTVDIIDQLTQCIESGQSDNSISADISPRVLAESLYQLWLGASLIAKVAKDTDPFDSAIEMTQRLLS
ncbi:TetR/AcrR family transcriptional regulator [Xenorhabdus bharatensis]|uniref:TetR/AcrR family transcriptional regulator n=1 Tax=Xenorhabdus bharatensis TaxID=3136256 RepID=UPI0030F3CAF7